MTSTPAGGRSEPPRLRFDPPTSRDAIRLTAVYATGWAATDQVLEAAVPLVQHLYFGRLEKFYRHSAEQLPAVVHHGRHSPTAVGLARWPDCPVVSKASTWLFVTPSRQLVAGLTLDLACAPVQAIPVLEDLYYEAVTLAGQPPAAFFRQQLIELAAVEGWEEFAPERHLLLFAPQPGEPGQINRDLACRLIYRADLPSREEFSEVHFPAELNRRPYAVGAVGCYGSVLAGQQDYVENSALVSAVQSVAAAATVRAIRERAYQAVRSLHEAEADRGDLAARRRRLGRLSGELSGLQLALSFSVEASGDLGVLVPALRVESYHDALARALKLLDRAAMVARMLERLERAITAELRAVETRQRQLDEDRRLRWAATAGFLTTVAIPLTILLAFFGANAREVQPSASMFDLRVYGWVYGTVLALVGLGAAVFLALLLLTRRRLDDDLDPPGQHPPSQGSLRPTTPQAAVAPTPSAPPPLLPVRLRLSNPHRRHRQRASEPPRERPPVG